LSAVSSLFVDQTTISQRLRAEWSSLAMSIVNLDRSANSAALWLLKSGSAHESVGKSGGYSGFDFSFWM
jgi:hypothetical protein